MTDETYERFLEFRHIETPCTTCQGSGVYLYGNTGVWYAVLHPDERRVYGQAISNSVCYKCWGSGDANKPWPSWDKFIDLAKGRQENK